MTSIKSVISRLKNKAKPAQLDGMAKFGLVKKNRLGVSVPDLRSLAKEIGKDHKLALKLWNSKILDARILAAMVDVPEEVTEKQMEDWVKDINSWDVCDQVCMNLFEKTSFAWKKIHDWSERDEEFVKRTAFALIACLAWHDKTAEDEKFIKLMPIIKREATDDRNFVRKAVNWSLRNIGKRNKNLNKIALKTAREISKIDSKVARWIASDTIRDLNSPATKRRLARINN